MITAGDVIKNKRESLGKDINSVSLDTKIQARFLKYIENNQFDKFDSSVFATGFIKIYAKYLGLDVEKILALYRRSTSPGNNKGKKEPILIKKRKGRKWNISPKTIAIVTLSIFVLLIVGYVGYQIYKFQIPPELTISEPTNEYVTNEQEILVQGLSQPSNSITVNGEDIQTKEDGSFEKVVSLNEGVNTITVKAQKDSNKDLETTQSIKVIYEPKEDGKDTLEIKEFLLSLTVVDSPSWIKLDVDNESKIEQIVQPNTINEYNVEENFSLVTGRIQNTKIQVNGEELSLTSSNNTGIGQIACQITDNELVCE